MKDKTQILLIIIGLISLTLGINTMLDTPTMILPSYVLVILYLPFVIGVSLVFALVIKKMLKSKWKLISFTSIFISIISLTFYISEYRETLNIIVPEDFYGTVHLVLSNSNQNDLVLNEFGVGYISEEVYNSGFKPKVSKGGKDITPIIEEYATGSASYDNGKSLNYLTFSVPGKNTSEEEAGVFELIKNNGIDTSRILIK